MTQAERKTWCGHCIADRCIDCKIEEGGVPSHYLYATSDVEDREATKNDAVNHPSHYTSHPSGVECIRVTEHMSFNLGNALKYIWRCDLKKDAVEDLKKAIWYINRELEKRCS